MACLDKQYDDDIVDFILIIVVVLTHSLLVVENTTFTTTTTTHNSSFLRNYPKLYECLLLFMGELVANNSNQISELEPLISALEQCYKW